MSLAIRMIDWFSPKYRQSPRYFIKGFEKPALIMKSLLMLNNNRQQNKSCPLAIYIEIGVIHSPLYFK